MCDLSRAGLRALWTSEWVGPTNGGRLRGGGPCMSMSEQVQVERLLPEPRSGLGPPRRRWMRRYLAALVVLDGCAATVAAVTAYLVRFSDGAIGYLAFSLMLPLAWVTAAALARAYDDRVVGLGPEEFQRIGHAFLALSAVIGFASYATKAEVARGYVVFALPMALGLSLLGRWAARRRLHALRRVGRCVHDVLAVGGEYSVIDLLARLRQEPYSGMRVIGACLAAGDGSRLVGLGVPLLGGLDDVAAAVRDSGADTVAVTSSAELDPTRLRRLAWELEGTATDLVVAPGLMEVAGPRLHIRPVTGLPLLHVEEPEFAGIRRLIKAVADRAVAAIVLVADGPGLPPHRGRRAAHQSGSGDLPADPDRQGRPRVHHAEVPVHVPRRRGPPRPSSTRSTSGPRACCSRSGTTRGSRGSGSSCAPCRWTSCRSWSTSCPGTCRSSARGRRCRRRSPSTTTMCAAGCWSSPD